MNDGIDDGYNPKKQSDFSPLNLKKKGKKQTAVSLKENENRKKAPLVTAAGRGKIAEKILNLAFENDIKVRQDSALAEILATIEIDSPIPSEAFVAVAEVLSYVYRANGQPNPFDAALKDDKDDV